MTSIDININFGAIEAIYSIIPLGNLSARSLEDDWGAVVPFYTMMKRNPTLSAQIIKGHFAAYIVSAVFKNLKNREFFWVYMLLLKKNSRVAFLNLISDENGIEKASKKLNHILALARDDIYATWACLPLIRRSLIDMEQQLGIAATIEVSGGSLFPIYDLIRQTKKMYFDFAYSNVAKRCHNPTCDNISTNQCSCHQTRYCSAACQLADWKRHKQTCQFIKK
jgi:MYND finger